MSKINGNTKSELRKPGGGWDEEETPTKINKVEVNKNSFVLNNNQAPKEKTPVYLNKEPESKKIGFEYESKVIDDILKPTGVTIKPSENQLNDFLKRIKAFNKEIVFKILIQNVKIFANVNDDQNQLKQLMKSLYVIEYILIKKTDGFNTLFSQEISQFVNVESKLSNNKKICDIINNILVLLGEKSPNNLPLNQQGNSKINSENNAKMLEELMSINTKEETFSGLEIRNKSNGNNQQTLNSNKNNNGFMFIKGKINQDDQTDVSQNKDLLKISAENLNKVDNNAKLPISDTSANKQGFTFLKSGKSTVQSNGTKDELSNVFQELNIVTKNENKETQPINNLNKTLQETYNNKLDLDKLYSETINNQFNNYNVTNSLQNNNQFPQQFGFNNNVPNQNVSYYKNYNLNISDLRNNQINAENYVPLDIKDFNKQIEKNIEQKNEKDHFDFVNDLLRKKK